MLQLKLMTKKLSSEYYVATLERNEASSKFNKNNAYDLYANDLGIIHFQYYTEFGKFNLVLNGIQHCGLSTNQMIKLIKDEYIKVLSDFVGAGIL